MVLDKMAAICPDFKRLSFQISDPIQNSGPFATQPLFNLQNPELSGFQILTEGSSILQWELLNLQWGSE